MKLEKKTKIIVGIIVCIALLAVTGGVYWMVKGERNTCINCENKTKKQETTEEKTTDDKPLAGDVINDSTEEPQKTTEP